MFSHQRWVAFRYSTWEPASRRIAMRLRLWPTSSSSSRKPSRQIARTRPNPSPETCSVSHSRAHRSSFSGRPSALQAATSARSGLVCSRKCILFHSIWKAVNVGTRSSTSDRLATYTASVSRPSKKERRRRPAAVTGRHCSTFGYPRRANTRSDWPITTSRVLRIQGGSRSEQ